MTDLPPAEAALLSELARLRNRIREMQLEAKSIERLVLRLRHENIAVRDVTRRNSAARILAEEAILRELRNAKGKTLSSVQLRDAARRADYSLKDATFRSHVHRLSKRGLITSPGFGRWKLVDT